MPLTPGSNAFSVVSLFSGNDLAVPYDGPRGCGCVTLAVLVVGGLLLAIWSGTTSPLLPILLAAVGLLAYVAYGFLKHG